MAQRAVIVSGTLGMGHEMMASAATEALGQYGWEVRTLSSMTLLGPLGGALGERVFRRLLSLPGLYDGLHFADLRQGGPLAGAMDAAAKRRLVPALRAELSRQPVDLVIAVFAAGASAVAELGREAPDRRTVVFCNDVTLHRLWVWEGIDLFCVTSPAAAASVRRFLPHAEVAVVAPPVRAAFHRAPGQAEARNALGVPPAARCALVMGGGWGLGPLADTAALLAEAGVHVLAVAGRNPRLERRLRVLAAKAPLVYPFGFSEVIPELMAAADVVVAPSGATTCSEARVVGRPLVILDVVPGHGRENLLHELELGRADVSNPRAPDIAASVLGVLERVERPAPASPRAPAWGPQFAEALSLIGVKMDFRSDESPS